MTVSRPAQSDALAGTPSRSSRGSSSYKTCGTSRRSSAKSRRLPAMRDIRPRARPASAQCNKTPQVRHLLAARLARWLVRAPGQARPDRRRTPLTMAHGHSARQRTSRRGPGAPTRGRRSRAADADRGPFESGPGPDSPGPTPVSKARGTDWRRGAFRAKLKLGYCRVARSTCQWKSNLDFGDFCQV